MNAENDRELLNFGIGFTNIVERTTRANQELSRQEIEEGEEYYYDTQHRHVDTHTNTVFFTFIQTFDNLECS